MSYEGQKSVENSFENVSKKYGGHPCPSLWAVQKVGIGSESLAMYTLG